MNVIMSFCGDCGSMLTPLLDNCENCNHPVKDKEGRIEGTFTIPEANRLLAIAGIPPIEVTR